MKILPQLTAALFAVAALTAAEVPSEKDMAAYLMVYFSDSDHSLHMALSSDGYSFTALNDNKPVIDGKKVAEQKGIRDPHIARGPDGAFYLAMTDLHIFAQREGYRDTEWQRDGANYDPKTKKMMLYFTMRFGGGVHKIYYSHMNDAFNRMLTKPEVLFESSNDVTVIDADITQVGDKFHMFYVSHEGVPGIKHAVSDSINSGFTYEPEWIDQEAHACEAPNLWKRIGEDKWVLMYDCYGINPHNFAFSETTDFKTFTPLGYFNQGVMKSTNFTSPKHGAVIHLIKQEADGLARHWKLDTY